MAARRYGWKDKRIGGDPTVVAKHLHQLERRYGALSPAIVVEEASAETSPLHRYFEWDNTVAAAKFREEQARGLLRAVLMESDAEPGVNIRAFLMIDTNEGGAYVNTVRALSDSQMAEQVLARAKAELRAFKAKYAHLQKLHKVIAAIEEVA
jgi:hypothetical protein